MLYAKSKAPIGMVFAKVVIMAVSLIFQGSTRIQMQLS